MDPMQVQEQSPAESAGKEVGEALGWVGEHFGDVGTFVGDFFGGVASGAGLRDPSVFTWIGLGFGGLLIIGAVSDLFKGDLIWMVAKGLLGVGILAYTIA